MEVIVKKAFLSLVLLSNLSAASFCKAQVPAVLANLSVPAAVKNFRIPAALKNITVAQAADGTLSAVGLTNLAAQEAQAIFDFFVSRSLPFASENPYRVAARALAAAGYLSLQGAKAVASRKEIHPRLGQAINLTDATAGSLYELYHAFLGFGLASKAEATAYNKASGATNLLYTVRQLGVKANDARKWTQANVSIPARLKKLMPTKFK